MAATTTTSIANPQRGRLIGGGWYRRSDRSPRGFPDDPHGRRPSPQTTGGAPRRRGAVRLGRGRLGPPRGPPPPDPAGLLPPPGRRRLGGAAARPHHPLPEPP